MIECARLDVNVEPTSLLVICFSLRTNRNFYNDLKTKLSMDPRGAVGDDPLSQNDEVMYTVVSKSLT